MRCHFHTYSFHNQLLIASQCPEATRVAGFRSWLSIGYAVRKGERGIRIWAPCPPSKKQLAEWKQASANPLEKPNTYFRLVAVFDRSQVDPVPEFPGGPVELELPSEPIDGDALAPIFQPLTPLAPRSARPSQLPRSPARAEGYYEPSTQEDSRPAGHSEVLAQRPGQRRHPRARPRPCASRATKTTTRN